MHVNTRHIVDGGIQYIPKKIILPLIVSIISPSLFENGSQQKNWLTKQASISVSTKYAQRANSQVTAVP